MSRRLHVSWGGAAALLACLLSTFVFDTARGLSASVSHSDVRLSTIPRRVFVNNVGRLMRRDFTRAGTVPQAVAS